ncbi:MAG TPA: hypothetical protein VK741_22795 [Acetobacteraceae bacterium]|nr:hypothetical protein [Acetobacteraceae bacterium]
MPSQIAGPIDTPSAMPGRKIGLSNSRMLFVAAATNEMLPDLAPSFGVSVSVLPT